MHLSATIGDNTYKYKGMQPWFAVSETIVTFVTFEIAVFFEPPNKGFPQYLCSVTLNNYVNYLPNVFIKSALNCFERLTR